MLRGFADSTGVEWRVKLLDQYCQQATVVPLHRQRNFAAENAVAPATTGAA